jgi:hypothetical protein
LREFSGGIDAAAKDLGILAIRTPENGASLAAHGGKEGNIGD